MLAKRIIVRDTTARGQWVEKRKKYHTQTNTERKVEVLRTYKLLRVIFVIVLEDGDGDFSHSA